MIDWRPAPLLCKRFNVPDPYRGKPEFKEDTPKSKFDSLSLPETEAEAAQEAGNLSGSNYRDRPSATMPISHQFGQVNPLKLPRIQNHDEETMVDILP